MLVAVCVWVCRCCHQSGGNDVVDNARRLASGRSVLDMFDYHRGRWGGEEG